MITVLRRFARPMSFCVSLSTKGRQTDSDERHVLDRWRVGLVEVARKPPNGVPL